MCRACKSTGLSYLIKPATISNFAPAACNSLAISAKLGIL